MWSSYRKNRGISSIDRFHARAKAARGRICPLVGSGEGSRSISMTGWAASRTLCASGSMPRPIAFSNSCGGVKARGCTGGRPPPPVRGDPLQDREGFAEIVDVEIGAPHNWVVAEAGHRNETDLALAEG